MRINLSEPGTGILARQWAPAWSNLTYLNSEYGGRKSVRKPSHCFNSCNYHIYIYIYIYIYKTKSMNYLSCHCVLYGSMVGNGKEVITFIYKWKYGRQQFIYWVWQMRQQCYHATPQDFIRFCINLPHNKLSLSAWGTVNHT